MLSQRTVDDMGQISTIFQPPKAWQDFESLTCGVLSTFYLDLPAQLHGRGGQKQDGVDIFLQSPRDNSWVGVQCKQMNELDEENKPRPGGKITKKFLEAQAKLAEKFAPSLNEFVLATTAKADIRVQQFARELSDKNTKHGLFRISVWSWDLFESVLSARHDLQKNYYQNIISIRSTADQDRLILEAIRTSFCRPAFLTPLFHEHADDFIQALKDTTQMLNTGVLFDRETRAIIHRTIGGVRAIGDPVVSKQLTQIRNSVQGLRVAFETGVADGRIQKRNGYVDFKDLALAADLENNRDLIVMDLDKVLRSFGMTLSL